MILSILCVTLAYVLFLFVEYKVHTKKLAKLRYRIHVNGIRGKSSVTRLLTALLQGAKIVTVGKATGSASKVINHHGKEVDVIRKGNANVFENVKVLRNHVHEDVQAVVFECMAVNPKYQKFLEEKVIQSNIGIITNVREDHMEVLGYSLEEIATNLASTIPYNGVLIISESNPKLRKLLEEIATKRGSTCINALRFKVEDSYVKDFPFYEHKSNIQIALAVANHLDIAKPLALDLLKSTIPDVGITKIEEFSIEDKKLTWVNLFSVNDRESVVSGINKISDIPDLENKKVVCVLNHRFDRPDRASQFLDIVTKDLKFDLVVTLGAFEDQSEHFLKEKKQKHLILKHKQKETGRQMLDKIFAEAQSKDILLFGLENIHTHQAEQLMHCINSLTGKYDTV